MWAEQKNIQERILIVDDSKLNRLVLRGMLEKQYWIEEAENAEDALAILSKRSHDFALILLDLVMPGMGGFGLLEYMNRYGWLNALPVIMVSSETDTGMVKRAYALGVTDFIRRPYEEDIVQQRIKNTLKLYAQQRQLIGTVTEQYYENEKNANLMIAILSQVVGFRNGETGPHIRNIKKISWFLMQQVLKRAGPQTYTAADVHMLCKAAALHDIGKIAIPGRILNKPGRLNPEEYAVMKTHARIGAQMLEQLVADTHEPLAKAAYEICRWHHERWDGGGYPDGLKGDAIPIHAQVVALADVYDALTSKRCYKEAYSHEKAIAMIRNGECGVFNPMLLDCMEEVEQELKDLLKNPIPEEMEYDPSGLLDNMGDREDLSMTRDLVHRVAVAQDKVRFLSDVLGEPCFFYCCHPSMIDFSPRARQAFGVKEKYVEPEKCPEFLRLLDRKQAESIRDRAYQIPRAQSDYTVKATLCSGGESCPCTLLCRNVWLLDPPVLCGVIGVIRPDEKTEN